MTNNTRHKILLHACPRCQGDLFPDYDDAGFFSCLQCGRTIRESQLEPVAAVQAVPTEGELAKAA